MATKFLALGTALIGLAFACLRFLATRDQRAAAGAHTHENDQPVGGVPHAPTRGRPEALSANRISDSSHSGRVPALTKARAEELLDWLEVHGVRETRLSYVQGEGFTVWYG